MHQTSPSDQASPARQATPDQRALVLQALEDEDTYNKLYRGVTLWVFRLKSAQTREEAHTQAEEVLQEAVTQALAKLDTYDPARPAVNWLLGFALNVIRQMQRRRGREANRSDNAPPDRLGLIDQLHSQATQELLGLDRHGVLESLLDVGRQAIDENPHRKP